MVTAHEQNLFRSRRRLWQLVLALAGVFVISATVTAKASADCMTATDCFNAAQWQKAIADDDYNKGVWFQEQARQDFINAALWNDKATFAFNAGDATAAQWYKAIADDYAHKAAANSKAANDYFAQAKLFNAARNNSILRGLFLAGGVQSYADYPADPGNVDGTCASGDLCTAGAHKTCKRHPLDNYWHPRVSGADVYRAHVYTMWCFRNGVIVSRHSDTGDHHITDWGHVLGYEIDYGPDLKRSYCNAAKTVCFTRFQFGFRGIPVQTAGGCIETTIYGDGHHYRRAYGGECSDSWPI